MAYLRACEAQEYELAVISHGNGCLFGPANAIVRSEKEAVRRTYAASLFGSRRGELGPVVVKPQRKNRKPFNKYLQISTFCPEDIKATADSGSVSPGSNPGPAAPYKAPFCRAFSFGRLT